MAPTTCCWRWRASHLAFHVLLLREKLVFGELLGYRASSLYDVSCFDVVGEGSRCGDEVDAGMPVKTVVFDRHNGVEVAFRQLFKRRIARGFAYGRCHLAEARSIERLAEHVEPSRSEIEHDADDEDSQHDEHALACLKNPTRIVSRSHGSPCSGSCLI